MIQFNELSWPIPVVLVDQNLTILHRSAQAKSLMGNPAHLHDIVDEGNRNKLNTILGIERVESSGEVEIVNQIGENLLVDLSISWNKEAVGTVVIMPKDEAMNRISEQLNRLRTRLSDTNTELLAEKEMAESRLREIHRLSAPFTKLGSRRALVTIFGQLSEEKVASISEELLVSIKEQGTDELIIDFTPLGEVDPVGITRFKGMIRAIGYMGVRVKVSGISPDHVQALRELALDKQVQFIQTLEDVL